MTETRPPVQEKPLDRAFALEAVRVTEAAAIAAFAQIGRGNEHDADQAAVEAMRAAFNVLPIDGTVVIGEGERDEAPMLFIGEKVGQGGLAVDIALDPLEGTTLTAKAMANALAVMAMAEPGTMLNAPDTYMDKIAIGPGYKDGMIDLDAEPGDNINAIAKAKGVRPHDITALVMDRPRHEQLIAKIRKAGAKVKLITDGDVAGVIETTDPATGVDIYIGIGGAPEGVLAAAALRCVGGQMQGRLVFRNEDEKARAAKWGIKDLTRKYQLHDLVSGDVVFSATGVTDGSMLRGVHREGNYITTESVVMRSATGTVRWIKARHRRDRCLRPVEPAAAAFGVARSFSGRRWLLKPVDEELERELLREISPVLARLLALARHRPGRGGRLSGAQAEEPAARSVCPEGHGAGRGAGRGRAGSGRAHRRVRRL